MILYFFLSFLGLALLRAHASNSSLITLHPLGGKRISSDRQQDLAAAVSALDSNTFKEFLSATGSSAMCIVQKLSATEVTGRAPSSPVLHQMSWFTDEANVFMLRSFLESSVSTHGIFC